MLSSDHALKLNAQGKCANCETDFPDGEKRYHDVVFKATVYASDHVDGYNVAVQICAKCRLEKMERQRDRVQDKLDILKMNIDSMRGET